jgi:hypothetical protein
MFIFNNFNLWITWPQIGQPAFNFQQGKEFFLCHFFKAYSAS